MSLENRPFQRLIGPILLFIGLMATRLEIFPVLSLLPDLRPETLRGPMQVAVDVLLWLVGATLFNRLAETYFWNGLVARAFGGTVPKLLIDVSATLTYVAAVAAVAVLVFDRSLDGLWATSGIVGLVLGLALRNVILDIFIGLAVNFDRPYQIGDWIMVHGRRPDADHSIIGCITGINWRTTRLKTTENNLVLVPNNVMGQKVVTNFMAPEAPSRFELDFTLDFSVPTERALRVLGAALLSTPGVLEAPRSKVRISHVSEVGVIYRIRYWILPAETSPNKMRHRLTSSVLEHLRVAGLTLAYPKHDVYRAPMPTRHLEGASIEDRRQLLSAVPLFAGLHREELDSLARSTHRKTFRRNQELIRQGELGDSMYVLIEGLLDVHISVPGGDERAAAGQIQPGRFFGEMSLLTGEPRTATIRAVTDAVVYEVQRESLEPLIQARPEIAEEMGRALAVHQLRDAQARTQLTEEEEQRRLENAADRILSKMKKLLFTWSARRVEA